MHFVAFAMFPVAHALGGTISRPLALNSTSFWTNFTTPVSLVTGHSRHTVEKVIPITIPTPSTGLDEPATSTVIHGTGTGTQARKSHAPLKEKSYDDCDYMCRLYTTYTHSYQQAALGVALVLDAYNSSEWCVNGPGKSWCEGTINATLSQISSISVKDHSVIKKDCDAECLANHLLDTGYNATALGCAWALRTVNGTTEGSDLENEAMTRLNQTATPLLSSRWQVNSTAFRAAMAQRKGHHIIRDDQRSSANVGSPVPGHPHHDKDNKHLGLFIGLPLGIAPAAILAAWPAGFNHKGRVQAPGGKTTRDVLEIIKNFDKMTKIRSAEPEFPGMLEYEKEDKLAQMMDEAHPGARAAQEQLWAKGLRAWGRETRKEFGGLEGNGPTEPLVPGKKYRVERFMPDDGRLSQKTVEAAEPSAGAPPEVEDDFIRVKEVLGGGEEPEEYMMSSPFAVSETALNELDGVAEGAWQPVAMDVAMTAAEGEVLPEVLAEAGGALALDSLGQPIARVGEQLATLEWSDIMTDVGGITHMTYKLLSSAGESLFNGLLDVVSFGSDPPVRDSVKARRRRKIPGYDDSMAPPQSANPSMRGSVGPEPTGDSKFSDHAPSELTSKAMMFSTPSEFSATPSATMLAGYSGAVLSHSISTSITNSSSSGVIPMVTLARESSPGPFNAALSHAMSTPTMNISTSEIVRIATTAKTDSSSPVGVGLSRSVSSTTHNPSTSGVFAMATAAETTSVDPSIAALSHLVSTSTRCYPSSEIISIATATETMSSGPSTATTSRSGHSLIRIPSSAEVIAMFTSAKTMLPIFSATKFQTTSTSSPTTLFTATRAPTSLNFSSVAPSMPPQSVTTPYNHSAVATPAIEPSHLAFPSTRLPRPSHLVSTSFRGPALDNEIKASEIPSGCNSTLPAEGYSWRLPSTSSTSCPIPIPFECSSNWANMWQYFERKFGFPHYCTDPDPMTVHREAKALHCLRDEIPRHRPKKHDGKGKGPFSSEVCRELFFERHQADDAAGCAVTELPEGLVWGPPKSYRGCPVATPIECTDEWMLMHQSKLPQDHPEFPRYCADTDPVLGHASAQSDGCLPDFEKNWCAGKYFGMSEIHTPFRE